MKRYIAVLVWFCASITLISIAWFHPPGRAAEPANFDARFLDAFSARCIGPANMGGRIVDVAVVESNPAIMYVATASGGLWKTTDNGASWTPIFDHQNTVCLGDVTVAPSDPNIVWVGTGEGNPRNSVAWGDGVYRSLDGGKTWQHMGLKDTHHIGRIVIHPKHPEIVYVAALGHFWGPNRERGIFKTTDGGKTWEHCKYIDDNTGFVDIAMDPVEPHILYAAAYCVRRDGFSGGNPAVQFGPGAGLYKTSDGGRTWEKMVEGLPQSPLGRCGLDIYRKDPNVVYAVVQTPKTSQAASMKGPPKDQGPEGGGVFRSDDKGRTWKYLNPLCPRPFYYGQIRIDPNDDQRIYVLGVQFHVSNDGGKTFPAAKGTKGIHPDHHALWINPKDSKHLVLGNDGGLYFSENRAASFRAIRGFAIGQFYAVAVDMRRPYRVYGGLQDNGSWGGASATTNDVGITLDDWYRVAGADGFYCQVDPTNPDVVYAEAQYGRPQRIDLKTKKGKSIQPKAAKGEPSYRFNWNTPMLLSLHNPQRLYYGGNHLFRSDNRGDKWEVISPDLTRGQPGPSKSTGHTLTTIAESPRTPGILWVGSDDGRVHVTRDGGKTWTDLTEKIPGVPADRWITRLEASHFDEGTAYMTIDRHRNDDFKPYVFKTTDFGATWKNITHNLPAHGPVHVIRESSRNKDLLFAGTEFGLFVSLNAGEHWYRFKAGLPTVAVHDLVIHPRERDLVIGTHGRSVWVMDISPLEELSPATLARDYHFFNVRPAVAYAQKKSEDAATKSFVAANPAYGASLSLYFRSPPKGDAKLSIVDPAGKTLTTLKVEPKAGFQSLRWNLRAGDALVEAREYQAVLEVAGQKETRKVQVQAAD